MKTVKGYEGKYSITNDGKVYSFGSDKFIASWINNSGYVCVTLHIMGSKKNYLVHRLVAIAYLENSHSYSEVNHKDMDKCNNHYSNLEWCTTTENSYHSFYSKKTSDQHNYLLSQPGRFGKKREIIQYTMADEFIQSRPCVRSAGRSLGVDSSTISKVARGERTFAGGFKRRYGNV